MDAQPNIQGWVDAQARLRDKFGMDVRLFTPSETMFASGTVLDPTTGRAYDPRIKPVASGFASATVRATVIGRRLTAQSETEVNAAGVFSDRSVALGVSPEDWTNASGATEFELLDQRYEIRDVQPDGFAQTTTRFLVFGERK